MTYTCEIITRSFDSILTFKRTIKFEAKDGAKHLRKEITKYQKMGLKYNAELRQKTDSHFKLIWTERG